jgi:hypothetical protein
MRHRQREGLGQLRHGPQQPGLAVLLGEDLLLRRGQQRQPILGRAGHPGPEVEAMEQPVRQGLLGRGHIPRRVRGGLRIRSGRGLRLRLWRRVRRPLGQVERGRGEWCTPDVGPTLADAERLIPGVRRTKAAGRVAIPGPGVLVVPRTAGPATHQVERTRPSLTPGRGQGDPRKQDHDKQPLHPNLRPKKANHPPPALLVQCLAPAWWRSRQFTSSRGRTASRRPPSTGRPRCRW